MKRFARFFLEQSKELYETDIASVLRFVHSIFEKKAEDDKRPRDPRPILTGHPGMKLWYSTSQLEFALLSEKHEIISATTHCRDYFNEAIRFHISGTISHHCSEEWPGSIDMKKLRIALFLDEAVHYDISPYEGIKNGVRLANMYGRVAGWSPIRMVRARIPYEYDKHDHREKECYVLVGDRNWQRTPQYISMLILLLRICLVYRVPEWITDAYALTGYWHEFLYDTQGRPDNSDITVYLANSYHHMLLMMAHDRDIFPFNMLTGFGKKVAETFHGHSGLNSLVQDNSTHPQSARTLAHYYNTEVLRECQRM